MVKKNNNTIIAIALITFIGLMGASADKCFIRYELFDEMNSNYEFITADDKDISLAYMVNFPLKSIFVDFNGYMRNLFGQRTMNGVVKLNNGHLILPEKKFTKEQTDYCAKQIVDFAQYCSSQGSNFVYIQPPINTDVNNKQLPPGVEDYRNENVDGVIKIIKSHGVNVIDLRQCMKDDDMDIYDYVYKTDHHWNTIGAFYGFQHITDYIEDVTGKRIDPKYTNLSNYRIKKYSNWHLGSAGQRVGQFFAGADDYDLILPKFETRLSNGDGNIYTFEELAVNKETFRNKDATNRYTYDRAFSVGWNNVEKATPISVLILSDSYFTAISPYMNLAYDGYLYNYWPEGLKADTVKNMQPDAVIYMPYIYNDNNLKYIPPTENQNQ